MAFWAAAGALGGWGLAAAAQGLAQLQPDFAWMEQWAPAAGALGGIAAVGLLALLLRAGFDLDAEGALAVAGPSLLPAWAGFAWPLAARLHLPPPHDLPERPLQIFLAAILLSCLSVLLWRLLTRLQRRGDALTRPRWLALRLGALGWTAALLSGAWITQWTTLGDSPHYLMSAHAMAERSGTELSSDYKRKVDLLFYDHGRLSQPIVNELGRIEMHHPPGVAILISPGWKLLGPWGSRWVYAGMAALAGAAFFLLLCRLGLARNAVPAWALLTLSAPWVVQAPGMMPELAVALTWVLALASLRKATSPWAIFTMAGLLFWLNLRCLPLGFTLLIAGAWRFPKQRWGGVALALAFFVASEIVLKVRFGSWHPFGIYRDVTKAPPGQFYLWTSMPKAFFGLLLDQEYGLLFWAPGFFLGIAGLRAALRRAPQAAVDEGLILLAYALPLMTVVWWHGEMAPSRYLNATLPLVTLWAAHALDLRRPGQRILLGLTWAGAWLMAVLPWLCYSKQQGENLLLKLAGAKLGLALTALFPSYIVPGPSAIVWALLALGAAAWSWRAWGAPRPS